MRSHDYRTEAALYWSAISLIVCEDLPLDEAARRLGVDDEWLREILFRRKTEPVSWPHTTAARGIHSDRG